MIRKYLSDLFRLDPDYEKRVFGLDVFRAVAIILVVISHGSFMVSFFAPGFPYFRFIDGVELFFVLSGFLIGTILLKILNSNENTGMSTLWWFWKRRWLRTLPNYYLILLVNVLLVYFGIIKGDFSQFSWKFLLFLHNFSTPFTDFFWESWSLSIEEWFYIIFPFTLFLILTIFKVRKKLKTVSMISILTFILLPLWYRHSLSDIIVDKFWHDVTFRKVVMTRIDSIMFGVMMAWLKFYYQDFFFRFRVPMFITGLIIIYSVILPVHDPNSLFMKTWYFSIVGIGACLLIPLADGVRQFKTRIGRYITHISLVSYSMYLLNLAPIAQVIELNFMPDSSWTGFLAYLTYWLLVICLSTLLYKYFEKPIMDLRK